jgi:phi13 family phage major tail protein
MTINQAEYKSKIGLDMLYIAEVLLDTAATYSADTPVYLAPAAEASQEPSTTINTQYADDVPFDNSVSEGPTKITISVTNIPLAILALMTGKVFDETTGRFYDNAGTPPNFALAFRAMKSNGHYRYYQYLNGTFSMPKEEAATKGESTDPKNVELEYTAIPTIHKFDQGSKIDVCKRVIGDEDVDAFDATGWFSQVQIPGIASVSALALSLSDPEDDETGVSKSGNLTLTFNNALVADAINNIILVDSNNDIVETVVTLDATKKIITIDPAADLSGTADYAIVIAGVKDIYGDTLSDSINFTTAA